MSCLGWVRRISESSSKLNSVDYENIQITRLKIELSFIKQASSEWRANFCSSLLRIHARLTHSICRERQIFVTIKSFLILITWGTHTASANTIGTKVKNIYRNNSREQIDYDVAADGGEERTFCYFFSKKVRAIYDSIGMLFTIILFPLQSCFIAHMMMMILWFEKWLQMIEIRA